MKTKTLSQIEAQTSRLIWMNGAFVGRDNTPTQLVRAKRIEEISYRYYLNIKHYFGASTMDMQRGTYDEFKTPQSIYIHGLKNAK